jgi:glycosyltransferase involved in cell wall biosynthesis
MDVLFISIAWPAPGNRNLYSDLMDEFVQRGHRVHVAATRYDSDTGGEEIREENGIRVLRIHSGKIMKTSYLKKALALFTLGGKMRRAIHRHYGKEHYDLLIAPTPPITLSILYRKLKRKYRASFYLLLKDIWPQGSLDLGVFRKYSIPWFYFRIHEKRLYRVADHIGTMSPMGASYIRAHNPYLQGDKVEVCPNSIRPVEKVPPRPGPGIRDKYGIPRDACVFIFSGNLGVGHGLHFMLEAFSALSDYPKAYFVIGGAGTHYSFLEKNLKESSPGNVFLYSWLPREDFEQMLNTSDVGLILLYKYTSPQFPSRLLSYLEYAKAVLCAVNDRTDIGTIVEEEGCGRSVDHGDLQGFVEAVKYLSEHEAERKGMGEQARRLIMDRYTVSHSYEIIMDHYQNRES